MGSIANILSKVEAWVIGTLDATIIIFTFMLLVVVIELPPNCL